MKKVIVTINLVSFLAIGFLTVDIQSRHHRTGSFSAVVNPFNAYPYYGMRYANWRRSYPWKYRRHYWPYFPYDAQRMSAGQHYH